MSPTVYLCWSAVEQQQHALSSGHVKRSGPTSSSPVHLTREPSLSGLRMLPGAEDSGAAGAQDHQWGEGAADTSEGCEGRVPGGGQLCGGGGRARCCPAAEGGWALQRRGFQGEHKNPCRLCSPDPAPSMCMYERADHVNSSVSMYDRLGLRLGRASCCSIKTSGPHSARFDCQQQALTGQLPRHAPQVRRCRVRCRAPAGLR